MPLICNIFDSCDAQVTGRVYDILTCIFYAKLYFI